MDPPNDGHLNKLDKETIIFLLSLLNTPRDLACVACACRSLHQYVIEGELWKRLCIKLFPEVGIKFECLIDGSFAEEAQRAPHGYSQHHFLQSSTYCFLLQRLLNPPLQRTCIAEPLHASSTDNLPVESIAHTLYPEPEYSQSLPSYWSSMGEESTSVPETLTYRLVSNLCVVYDVRLQPFQAGFQPGNPIYSSKTVKFRFGYAPFPKSPWSGLFLCLRRRSSKRATTDDYVWTYESPAFPMAQENTLQTFRLPKPVLCIGGIFQIEFQGRVQKQATDDLFYICVSHVCVTGRPILNFEAESVDPNKKVVLRRLGRKANTRSSPSYLSLAAALQKNDGLSIIEHLRLNRSNLRNGSIVEMLFLYLLDAKLLDDPEEEE